MRNVWSQNLLLFCAVLAVQSCSSESDALDSRDVDPGAIWGHYRSLFDEEAGTLAFGAAFRLRNQDGDSIRLVGPASVSFAGASLPQDEGKKGLQLHQGVSYAVRVSTSSPQSVYPVVFQSPEGARFVYQMPVFLPPLPDMERVPARPRLQETLVIPLVRMPEVEGAVHSCILSSLEGEDEEANSGLDSAGESSGDRDETSELDELEVKAQGEFCRIPAERLTSFKAGLARLQIRSVLVRADVSGLSSGGRVESESLSQHAVILVTSDPD